MNLEFEMSSSKDKARKAEKAKNGEKRAKKSTVFLKYLPRY